MKRNLVEKSKNPTGSPSTFTMELGEKICRAISTSTESMTNICKKNHDFPVRETIWQWRLDFPSFGNMYAIAKSIQADLLAEEILQIADDGANDTYVDDEGNTKTDSDVVARSRLRIDTRKWIACKLLPKVYGEKTDHTHDITVRQEDILKGLE